MVREGGGENPGTGPWKVTYHQFGAGVLAQPGTEDRESPTAAQTRSDFGGECQPPPCLPTCGDSRWADTALTALSECVNSRLCVCSHGGGGGDDRRVRPGVSARIAHWVALVRFLRQSISLCSPGCPELAILLSQPLESWEDLRPRTDASDLT